MLSVMLRRPPDRVELRTGRSTSCSPISRLISSAASLVLMTLPTKELFVHVLTRDIRLEDAVLDLVDNCIDGAKRLHPGEQERFDGNWVKIELGVDKFSISDNCGGIPVDTARHYAFRFGRDPKMAKTPNSIGQFGVGMKRALLRFGRHFTVSSTTDTEHFEVAVDVDKWLEKPDWHFEFSEIRSPHHSEKPGTTIEVTMLTRDASARFPVAEFGTELINQLEKNAQEYLARGLTIEVNNTPVIGRPFQLLFDDSMVPAKRTKTYFADTEAPVYAEFISGVGESAPMEAGWYVACNGRVVLSADQSRVTGWDSIGADSAGVPKYHNQFSRFRGYASFQCIDAGNLPWNTMKTNVDPDAIVYQDARREMLALMRPVIDFLNRLDKENDDPDDERPLTALVEKAKPEAYNAGSNYVAVFRPTVPARPPKPRTTSIQFRRPTAEVDELVEALSSGSARKAGEYAWIEAYEKYVEGGE